MRSGAAVAEGLPPASGRVYRGAAALCVTCSVAYAEPVDPLAIVQVSPYPWEDRHEVNTYVERLAPSVSSVALRHSRALNVGTFHAPAERVVATQVARKLVTLVFGRLDARHAAYGATADLLNRFFPASYELARPGTTTPTLAP